MLAEWALPSSFSCPDPTGLFPQPGTWGKVPTPSTMSVNLFPKAFGPSRASLDLATLIGYGIKSDMYFTSQLHLYQS